MIQPTLQEPPNDEVILVAIDNSFSKLGESAKQAIWYTLEKNFGISRNDLVGNIDRFEQILGQFFGLGYEHLRVMMIHSLSEVTGEYLSESASLACTVQTLKENIRKKPSSLSVRSHFEIHPQ